MDFFFFLSLKAKFNIYGTWNFGLPHRIAQNTLLLWEYKPRSRIAQFFRSIVATISSPDNTSLMRDYYFLTIVYVSNVNYKKKRRRCKIKKFTYTVYPLSTRATCVRLLLSSSYRRNMCKRRRRRQCGGVAGVRSFHSLYPSAGRT